MNDKPAEILSTEGLYFSYGSGMVLHDVSLGIHEGATGLLGPNGAGKTTLLQILLGLLKPRRGQIRVFGQQSSTFLTSGRMEFGYLPENDTFIPGMTGVEMVAYLARLTGLPAAESMARAHEALYYVGLGEARYRPVSSFSTGMRQRVKLAQALAHGPRLVFLDEPTNGLDPHGREEMLELIRDLWENKGVSVLISSHLLPDVEATCRSVIVLHDGRVVESRALPEEPVATTLRFELRLKDQPELFAARLRERGTEVQVQQNGSLLVALPEGQDTELLFDEALRSNLQIRYLMPLQTSLEDIFVKAVGG